MVPVGAGVLPLASVLLVLDFDHTVIGVDSDRHVFQKLPLKRDVAAQRMLQAQSDRSWNRGMDETMAQLHDEGISVEQIREHLRKLKIEPALKDALSAAHRAGADVRILSDANTFFIDTILAANGLADSVDVVLSNPATIDASGRVRIAPYHTTPHPPESTSPPNLCKGRVMQEWLRERAWAKVVYGGDGGGDFEGAMRVPKGGVVLAREGFALLRQLQEERLAGGGPAGVLQAWKDQADLGRALQNLLLK